MEDIKAQSLALASRWGKISYHDWMAEWDRQIDMIVGDDPKCRAMIAVALNLNRMSSEGMWGDIPFNQILALTKELNVTDLQFDPYCRLVMGRWSEFGLLNITDAGIFLREDAGSSWFHLPHFFQKK